MTITALQLMPDLQAETYCRTCAGNHALRLINEHGNERAAIILCGIIAVFAKAYFALDHVEAIRLFQELAGGPPPREFGKPRLIFDRERDGFESESMRRRSCCKSHRSSEGGASET